MQSIRVLCCSLVNLITLDISDCVINRNNSPLVNYGICAERIVLKQFVLKRLRKI